MYIKPIQYRQFLPYGITIRSTDVLEKLTDYRYCLKICHDKDTRQLEAYDQPVYIEPADGIAMLVVQGAQTEAFLFARPVSINPGVYYCVLPYGCRESSYHEYTLGDRHCLPFDPTPYIYSTNIRFSITNIYTFLYSEKKANYVFIGEKHPFWELMYVDRGQILCTVEGEKYRLKQGDLIFYQANEFHSLKAIGTGKVAFLNIAFGLSSRQNLLNERVYHIDTDIQQYFKRMITESTNISPYSVDLVAAYLKLIFVHLMVDMHNNNSTQLTSAIALETHGLLAERVRQIVDEYLMNSALSVSYVAQKMHISTSYLYRVFMAEEKKNLQSYILEKKLERAKEMIGSGEYTISEVSERLNFCSPTYFSTQFKKAFGCTPREYGKTVYFR